MTWPADTSTPAGCTHQLLCVTMVDCLASPHGFLNNLLVQLLLALCPFLAGRLPFVRQHHAGSGFGQALVTLFFRTKLYQPSAVWSRMVLSFSVFAHLGKTVQIEESSKKNGGPTSCHYRERTLVESTVISRAVSCSCIICRSNSPCAASSSACCRRRARSAEKCA